jgi:hypothetical protein
MTHEIMNPTTNDSIKRMEQFLRLKEGDKIELTTGEIFTFIRFKRTKFVAKSDNNNKMYDVPEHMFKSLIQKAAPKQTNYGYTTLNPGELFCIKGNKGETILVKFKEIKNGKIKGEDPFSGMTWTIDSSSYLGKLSDIK